MRKSFLVILVSWLVVALASGPGRADDQADGKAVIDKAIKAVGGEAKLAKRKAETWKTKGTWYGMGDGIAFTSTGAVQWPKQRRMNIESDQFKVVLVVNGDKGWMKFNDNTDEMDKDRLAEAQEELHAGYVSTLLPLQGKAYKLSLAGEIKIDGQPAIGVKAAHKDHRDVDLFFDKKTGLLLKSKTRVKDMQSGNEVDQETLYSDYKEMDGIKRPTKMTINRDGKKWLEQELLELKAEEKLDDGVFDKP